MKSNADISIAYQIHGNKENPVILIIQGLGMPLTATPPEIIDELVARGYCLLLVDNRDIGHSHIIDEKIQNNDLVSISILEPFQKLMLSIH